MELEQDPNQRFFEILRDASDDKQDPIPEWELKGFVGSGVDRCICGTSIMLNYLIVHKRTQKQFVIGSECMKRWMNPKLVCKECESPLGCVAKRYRTNDFLCRCCKTMKKKMEEEESIQRAREKAIKERQRIKAIEKLSLFRLFWSGKYYLKSFKEVLQDESYVLYLMTIPDAKATESVKKFKEYASFFYDLVDVEV